MKRWLLRKIDGRVELLANATSNPKLQHSERAVKFAKKNGLGMQQIINEISA